MIDFLIFSAGRQTRFKSSKPKALDDFNGKTVLHHNVKVLKEFGFNSITVLIDEDDIEYYPHIKNVYYKCVKSGFGNAHSLYDLYSKTKITPNMYMMWGDTILRNTDIFQYTRDQYQFGSLLIPVLKERDPYVALEINKYKHVTNIRFRKDGDLMPDVGYHDQSIFKVKTENMFMLLDYSIKNLKKHEDLNIISLHNIALEMNMPFKTIEINEHSKTYAYNTIEEINSIKERLNE